MVFPRTRNLIRTQKTNLLALSAKPGNDISVHRIVCSMFAREGDFNVDNWPFLTGTFNGVKLKGIIDN